MGSRKGMTDRLARQGAHMVQFRRFWVPRGGDPDLSDDGFLVDPDWDVGEGGLDLRDICNSQGLAGVALPFESIDKYPVLVLLGELGIGKTTVLEHYHQTVAEASNLRGRVCFVDLPRYGEASLEHLFRSKGFKLRKNLERLQIFFVGFDQCLLWIPNLAGLLLEFLSKLPHDRVSLRIACRTADWSAELESGLRALWGQDSVGVYELTPLRRQDVREAVEDRGLPSDEFLKQVADAGAVAFANRPITLRFLLNSFSRGEPLPSKRTDLYREGCCVLCAEFREARQRHTQLSEGQRFAIASRLAAAVIFGGRSAIWTAPRSELPRSEDLRIDELLGGEESFGRETVQQITPNAVRETLASGLFRSRGEHRIGFSHRSYAEYLAAEYLRQRHVPLPTIRSLLFHPDGSGKIVPQLRDTAWWLAAMLPDVRRAILAKDPESVLVADAAPLAEQERTDLVRQLLRAYDSGELIDERLVRSFGKRLDGAHLKYPRIADDLRPYIRGPGKIVVRRVAMIIAEVTNQKVLQRDLLNVALSEAEPYEVRTIAVMVVGKIGDEPTKAQLKRLAIDGSENDPDDDLKGGALLATWPNHLTAEELISGLSPRKKAISGLYQRFLGSDIASKIKAKDMCIALDWALREVQHASSEIDPLARVGLSIIVTAVDFCQEPGVCERLADALVDRVEWFVRDGRMAAKLKGNSDARRAIGSIAIRRAQDIFIAPHLVQAGVVSGEDTEMILSGLDPGATPEEQRKFAFLIGEILRTVPWDEVAGFDHVVSVVRRRPVMLDILRPVLGPIEWPSEESNRLKAEYEAERRNQKPAPQPEVRSQIYKLLARSSRADERIFESICQCLLGDSAVTQHREDELLPHWNSLTPDLQNRVVIAAANYLNTECPVKDLSWIRRGHFPHRVMHGFWSLRLLSAMAPATFRSISEEVWRDWMSCVFGDPYSDSVVDGRHETVLKSAYQSARDRFLEVLDTYIEGQNEHLGSVHILDRVRPVWDEYLADMLNTKLRQGGIRSSAFEEILRVLIEVGDGSTLQFATNVVTTIPAGGDVDLDRPVAAAIQLLSRDVITNWPVVWRAIEYNGQFASHFFARLARDPYNPITTHLLKHLREGQLADVYIWLIGNGGEPMVGSGIITPEKALGWLSMNVLNELAERGTAVAYREIRRIQASLPDQRLEFVSKSTEDLVRRNTWQPLPATELLSLFLDGVPAVAAREIVPAGSDSAARIPLADLLKEAKARTADPKLRKKLVAVVRYNRYYEDLKKIKVACKRYQTPTLLAQKFPDLDVWAVLGDDDKADVAKGKFNPGRFAWSLVKRLINLPGEGDRTLKNYRNALKAAKLI